MVETEAGDRAARLPIYAVADAILKGIDDPGRVVLAAPTGSGKSTQVPQILLESGRIEREIVVLQPRRLATRMLAQRVAGEIGTRLGETVGYQMRFENVCSKQTRIRFVTEGVFLRQVLSDPELNGVGCVIFDEFHERNLNSDLGLACVMRALNGSRPDLKCVVMSATLDIEQIVAYLGRSHRVEASGRRFPVSIRYASAALGRDAAPVWERAASAFREGVREGADGDVLIFMPGAYEIRRTIGALEHLAEARDFEVLPLHGELTPEAQDRAVSRGDRRKVIVSTNVAETSITIEGVRVVIDSGLARIAKYDVRRGINSLLVQGISRASAEQRSGRAGRTAPGMCVRLWSEAEHHARPAHETPEVLRVDLAETLLLLSASGIRELDTFPWFQSPAADAVARSTDLLKDLGAWDAACRISVAGERMAAFPMHPRFARMLIEGAGRGVLAAACKIAALSQGRAVYRGARDEVVRRAQVRQIEDLADPRSDFFVHLKAWEIAAAARYRREACERLGIHAAAARQVGEVAKQIEALCRRQRMDKVATSSADPESDLCKAILAAFPDHVALRTRRGTRRCKMVHGRTGELRRESVVEADLLVAAEIEERELRGSVDTLLGMATAVEPAWLGELFPDALNRFAETRYNPEARRVEAVAGQRFIDLVLEQGGAAEPDPELAARLLAAEVTEGRLVLNQWNGAVENWIARVNFVARHCPESELSPIDDEVRALLVEQLCAGAVSYKDIKDRAVMPVLEQWVAPEQRYYLNAYAPAEIDLPRRKRPLKVRYEADGQAVIASKLQDFYDLSGDALKLAQGRVSPRIEFLAPNGRVAHVTDDLDGFWDGAYRHVRKDLAGRYPKHEWR